MTRFVVDARTAHDHFPGIGRYVSNLTRALVPQLGNGESLALLYDPSRRARWALPEADPGRVIRVATTASPFSIRQQVIIPRLLRNLGADSYHSPFYLMPYRAGKPTLLTVYDLIPELFPTYVSRRARLFFRLSMRMALNGSSIVTTISEATRADLLTRYAVDDAKVRVIPLAPDPAFRPAPDAVVRAVRQRYELAHQYVLYVGSNKPHKNLVRLLEAWAQLKSTIAADVVLAIAGHWDPRYPEARQKAEAPELAGRVVFCGPVPEEDLMPLMTGATAFVFPSEYEGFGLPVIEAMACGTAVACANRSSLPEVVGDAAALFAPDDVTDMAAALRRLLADSQWRQDLAEKGLARAGQFSWERTAAATLELYRGLAQ